MKTLPTIVMCLSLMVVSCKQECEPIIGEWGYFGESNQRTLRIDTSYITVGLEMLKFKYEKIGCDSLILHYSHNDNEIPVKYEIQGDSLMLYSTMKWGSHERTSDDFIFARLFIKVQNDK